MGRPLALRLALPLDQLLWGAAPPLAPMGQSRPHCTGKAKGFEVHSESVRLGSDQDRITSVCFGITARWRALLVSSVSWGPNGAGFNPIS